LKKTRKSRLSRDIIISCAISVVLLAALFVSWNGIRPDILWNRIAWPLTRLILIMGISLGLSALIEGMGWNSVVATLSRPLMRAGNFSDYSGTAFTSAFLSGVAANTLLWNAYQEEKITRREMLLATLLNLGLPSYFLHLPVTFAVIVPLVGRAGAVYITITLLAAVVRTVVVVLTGRMLLGQQPSAAARAIGESDTRPRTREEKIKKVRELLEKYLKMRLGKILCYTVPIYLFVAWLQQAGFFHWLQQASAHLFVAESLPVEGISVVVFSIVAEFTAGAAAAGAMLSAGVLTVKQTVTALLLGNIIATPVRALRHQLPRYLGIYQPKTGIQLLVMGQALRVTSVIMVGWLYYVIF
jgi:hypothetical protein